MSMFNTGDILETIEMFTQDNLDVRTVTMGISLLDCIDPDPKKACENIYNKITTKAANLVPTVEHISAEYGIPIINKRISVTPIAMLLGACPDADPVEFAKTLDAAGKKVGVNFVGGYSALVHKGFSAGDRRLIESIPRALAETDIVCSSVNIGATKAGLNMDAVKLMGEAVKKASELTAGRQCIGAAKLVVFCNAPEDNPFMAGAFHGPGEPDCEIHALHWPACPRMPPSTRWQSWSSAPPSRSPAWASWWPIWLLRHWACPPASSTCRWHLPPPSATVWPTFWKRWALRPAAAAAPPPASPC